MSNFVTKLLNKEYIYIEKNPQTGIAAKAEETNLFICHFFFNGLLNSPYEGGEYYGIMHLSVDYPKEFPSIEIITPNGRFKTSFILCLHVDKLVKGSWNMGEVIHGLRVFMNTNESATGSICTSIETKKQYAKESKTFNRNHPDFQRAFPELL